MLQPGDPAPDFTAATDADERVSLSKQKHALPFPLIADEDKAVVQAYGVWREKKNCGA